MIELANIKDITVSGKGVKRLYIDDKLVWERNNPHPSPKPEPPAPPPTPTSLFVDKCYWEFEDAISERGIYGSYTWSDGNNLYYSNGDYQYVLDETTPTPTWRLKTWSVSKLNGRYVWSDGTNIYYSGGSGKDKQYKLDGGDWVKFSGNGGIRGDCVWTDGTNIYHSDRGYTDKLVNGQWVEVSEWDSVYLNGYNIWSDGTNIYHTDNNTYKLVNGQWERVSEWDSMLLYGNSIFTDGVNIYHSAGSVRKYVLNKETGTWKDIPIIDVMGDDVDVYGEDVIYWNNGYYHFRGSSLMTITPIS